MTFDKVMNKSTNYDNGSVVKLNTAARFL